MSSNSLEKYMDLIKISMTMTNIVEKNKILDEAHKVLSNSKPNTGYNSNNSIMYQTYKAKLESNKQKRREKAAAKELKGGMLKATDTLQLTKKKVASSVAAVTTENERDRQPTNVIGNRLMTKKEKEEMIDAMKDKKGKAYTTTQDLREDPKPTDLIEIARLK